MVHPRFHIVEIVVHYQEKEQLSNLVRSKRHVYSRTFDPFPTSDREFIYFLFDYRRYINDGLPEKVLNIESCS